MSLIKRRIIEAISDRAPDEQSLLKTIQKEVWPFLQQVRRLLNGLEEAVHGDLDGRNVVHQHQSLSTDIDDGNPFTKNLLGSTNLRQAMVVLDQLAPAGETTDGIYDLLMYVPGLLNAGQQMSRLEIVRACRIPANFDGSEASAIDAALADTTLSVKLTRAGVTTTLGTITFAGGSATGTFSTATQTDLVPGDRILIVNQLVADVGLANVSVTIKVLRTLSVTGSLTVTGTGWLRAVDDVIQALATYDEPFFAVTIAAGVLSGFGAHRNLLVSGAGPLVGIDRTGIPAGAVVTLTFLAATTITAMAVTTATPIKTVKNGEVDWQDMDFAADDIGRFQLRTDGTPCFKYAGGSV